MPESIFLNYTLRPTTIRSNARYRGPTELSKYSNFIGEALHDMSLLGKVIDSGGTDNRGQSDFIKDNLVAYFSGDQAHIVSNIDTAGYLHGLGSDTGISLVGTDWTIVGAAIKTDLSTGVDLIGSNLNATSGITITYPVQEGQILYMRMKVEVLENGTTSFSIGSDDVNNGEGSKLLLDLDSLSSNPSYIGHMIECKYKEQITLQIYLRDQAIDSYNGHILINDFSVCLLQRDHYHLNALNSSLKSQVNVIEEQVNNIIKNM